MNTASRFVRFSALVGLLLLVRTLPGQPYAQGVVVTPLLKTTTTAAGQPIVYPVTDKPEVTAVLVEIPPGAKTGWHKHPVPCYGYILAGTLTVELENGTKNVFKAGDAVAEVVDLLHNGTNRGTEPVKLIMFVMGVQGAPFAVKSEAPAGVTSTP